MKGRVRLRIPHDHVIAIAVYAVISALLSWPTVRDFDTRLISDGVDARHNLWTFWHTLQAIQGKQSLFEAPLLYYPRGISMLVHGVGPLTSVFALPFWPWGPTAAYNGAILLAYWCSGYCSYLLARTLNFDFAVALFAGIMVMAAPMVLAGLPVHVTKVFVAALSIMLLTLHRALDPGRSLWWTAATGVAMLAVLLHNGNQFIFGALAIAFFTLAGLLRARGPLLPVLFKRVLLIGIATLIFTGPLVLAIQRAAGNPDIAVDVNQDSFTAPDLIQYLLPPAFSRLAGPVSQQVMQDKSSQTLVNAETAVSLSIAGIVLCLIGLIKGPSAARRWLLLTLLCVLFSLGPQVRLLGRTEFTEYSLPIVLPYAFLTGLPGLDFMRSPGRFMELGFIAFAISAAYGLAWLQQRMSRFRIALVGTATMLILLEVWPNPFPQETLPSVPAFYQQIASDNEEYGVFDLPLKRAGTFNWNWTTLFESSYFQIFQMVHHKGIASGYISRTYPIHPIVGDFMSGDTAHLFVDGRPALYVNFRQDLVKNNYRYVVLHKTLFADPDRATARSRELLDTTFEAPIVDDELVRVYQVNPYTETVRLNWGQNWREPETDWRWATTPATLQIESLKAQTATLELTPAVLHDPQSPNGMGGSGTLLVQVGSGPRQATSITAGQPAYIPITLAAGSQTITLALEAGNFKPSDYGLDDPSTLSFAMRSINLRTATQMHP